VDLPYKISLHFNYKDSLWNPICEALAALTIGVDTGL